jgi:hypothetical protein
MPIDRRDALKAIISAAADGALDPHAADQMLTLLALPLVARPQLVFVTVVASTDPFG